MSELLAHNGVEKASDWWLIGQNWQFEWASQVRRKCKISREDFDLILGLTIRSPDRETGGDLWGEWEQDGTCVIKAVTGPGARARHEVHAFHQDEDFMEAAGARLHKHKAYHIGTWHSHHRIGLPGPSTGDNLTFANAILLYKKRWFIAFIAAIEHGQAVVRPYFYARETPTEPRLGDVVIVAEQPGLYKAKDELRRMAGRDWLGSRPYNGVETAKKWLQIDENWQLDWGSQDRRKCKISRDDFDLILGLTIRSPDRETGGDLWGEWKQDGTCVVKAVTGPGARARHEVHAFHQDEAFMEAVGARLHKHKAYHIGTWHSHHRIGLPRPSAADSRTVANAIRLYKKRWFVAIIAAIENGQAVMRPYFYARERPAMPRLGDVVMVAEQPGLYMTKNELRRMAGRDWLGSTGASIDWWNIDPIKSFLHASIQALKKRFVRLELEQGFCKLKIRWGGKHECVLLLDSSFSDTGEALLRYCNGQQLVDLQHNPKRLIDVLRSTFSDSRMPSGDKRGFIL